MVYNLRSVSLSYSGVKQQSSPQPHSHQQLLKRSQQYTQLQGRAATDCWLTQATDATAEIFAAFNPWLILLRAPRQEVQRLVCCCSIIDT